MLTPVLTILSRSFPQYSLYTAPYSSLLHFTIQFPLQNNIDNVTPQRNIATLPLQAFHCSVADYDYIQDHEAYSALHFTVSNVLSLSFTGVSVSNQKEELGSKSREGGGTSIL